MDFLSEGSSATDEDVNRKSFEGMSVKRSRHRSARTRQTCGLSSSVYTDGHTVKGPPRTCFSIRHLTELEKREFRFNKFPSRAWPVGLRRPRPRSAQLIDTQVKVRFPSRQKR